MENKKEVWLQLWDFLTDPWARFRKVNPKLNDILTPENRFFFTDDEVQQSIAALNWVWMDVDGLKKITITEEGYPNTVPAEMDKETAIWLLESGAKYDWSDACEQAVDFALAYIKNLPTKPTK